MKAVIDLEKILSPQQYNVVRLLANGNSIAQTATLLGIKPSTIHGAHMRQIRKRLGIRSCAELRAATQAEFTA